MCWFSDVLKHKQRVSVSSPDFLSRFSSFVARRPGRKGLVEKKKKSFFLHWVNIRETQSFPWRLPHQSVTSPASVGTSSLDIAFELFKVGPQSSRTGCRRERRDWRWKRRRKKDKRCKTKADLVFRSPTYDCGFRVNSFASCATSKKKKKHTDDAAKPLGVLISWGLTLIFSLDPFYFWRNASNKRGSAVTCGRAEKRLACRHNRTQSCKQPREDAHELKKKKKKQLTQHSREAAPTSASSFIPPSDD